MTKANSVQTRLDPVSNDAEPAIEFQMPYVAQIDVEGSAAFLFHRYSVEAVAAGGAAAKGSKAKKTDAIDSYVWHDDEGNLSIPGEYFRNVDHWCRQIQTGPAQPPEIGG